MAHHRPQGLVLPTLAAAAVDSWRSLHATLTTTRTPCQGDDAAAWFAEDTATRAQAAQACTHCPARRPCAAYATSAGERHGVWAGIDRGALARRPDLDHAPAHTRPAPEGAS